MLPQQQLISTTMITTTHRQPFILPHIKISFLSPYISNAGIPSPGTVCSDLAFVPCYAFPARPVPKKGPAGTRQGLRREGKGFRRFLFSEAQCARQDHSEFFAVISEVFFLTPQVVAGEYQALYDLLCRYYRQDPLQRLTKAASADSTAAS